VTIVVTAGLRMGNMALLRNFDTTGFATLAVLSSLIAGHIPRMLGVIGEYLWRVFDTANDIPEAVIYETLR
jgi:hypothetical protein